MKRYAKASKQPVKASIKLDKAKYNKLRQFIYSEATFDMSSGKFIWPSYDEAWNYFNDNDWNLSESWYDRAIASVFKLVSDIEYWTDPHTFHNYIIVGDTADMSEDYADAAVSEFVDFCKSDVYMFGDKVCLDDEFDALDNLNYYQGIWDQIKESYTEE